jgi:hypothetical protein
MKRVHPPPQPSWPGLSLGLSPPSKLLIIFYPLPGRSLTAPDESGRLREIPCSGPKAGINSLHAQNNSLLAE